MPSNPVRASSHRPGLHGIPDPRIGRGELVQNELLSLGAGFQGRQPFPLFASCAALRAKSGNLRILACKLGIHLVLVIGKLLLRLGFFLLLEGPQLPFDGSV